MTMKMVQSNKFLRAALCLVLGRKIGSKLFESRLIANIYRMDTKQIPPPRHTTCDAVDIARSHPCPEKCVIYLSDDSSDFSPGLADKLKGCLSSYLLCKKYALDFKIYWDEPFELTDYLEPNRHDWFIPKKEIIRDPEVSRPVLIMEQANIALQNWINHRVFKMRILRGKCIQTHLYTNMIYGTDRFHQAFEELFKPSDKLNAILNEHLQKIGKYISVSTRFMGLLGDFRDENGFNTALEKNQAKALLDHSMDALEKIILETPEEYHIFIASDSTKFINRAMQLERTYIIPGKIGHSKFKCADEILLKTFVDFFMLKEAHKSYLLKSKEMYGSGFPWLASKVGGHAYEIVEI